MPLTRTRVIVAAARMHPSEPRATRRRARRSTSASCSSLAGGASSPPGDPDPYPHEVTIGRPSAVLVVEPREVEVRRLAGDIEAPRRTARVDQGRVRDRIGVATFVRPCQLGLQDQYA